MDEMRTYWRGDIDMVVKEGVWLARMSASWSTSGGGDGERGGMLEGGREDEMSCYIANHVSEDRR